MTDIEHILAAGDRIGEGPLWHPDEQALYWVDIEGQGIHRLDPASGAHVRWPTDLPVTALGIREAGGFVVATRDGFAFWTPPGALTFIADPESDRPAARFNDGAVDRAGRFWAGTMSPTPTSSLYRLDPDGTVHTMETGITTANGLGWSPDNRTMYFTDSPAQVIYAYDFDLATSAISNRRPFVATSGEWGFPDGLAVDAEGYVWSARWDGGKVTRYDPTGRAVQELHLPVKHITSCAFGGPDLADLYITSAWSPLDDAGRAAQPQAGDLFRARPGVRGLPVSRFTG
jgi:sugar lactone lactonase YvrE